VQQAINITDDANRDGECYWTPWRIKESGRYQYHVYRWAANIIRRAKLDRVLDVGCGVATKLEAHLAPTGAQLVGLDQPSAVRVCRELARPGEFVAVDLERPIYVPDAPFDLIICADVVEHLVDPDPMLDLISQCLAPGGLVIISTPDRARERGRDCCRSEKPEHVREWARHEFVDFLRSRRFTVHASRLFPKDDAPPHRASAAELAYRLRLAPRSPLGCHAVLASIG
jgi:SAM-dependent methyltransferase